MNDKKRIAFDLDGTLTLQAGIDDYKAKTPLDVEKMLFEMKPDMDMIRIVNELSERHVVYIYTARNDIFQEVTIRWLDKYGVKYDYVVMNKEFYDYFIDDKAMVPADCKLLYKMGFFK